MKLFQNLLSGKNKCRIIAPVSGKLVSVKEAKDPTFRDEILGKSVTVIPSENRFYSPADGVVTTVFPTGHAVAITTTDGAEVLIHVGINTVKLNGKFFNLHVKEGQKVSAGDLLLEADIEQIQKEGYQIIEWNETNCSFNENDFIKKSYSEKKWAFVAAGRPPEPVSGTSRSRRSSARFRDGFRRNARPAVPCRAGRS